MDGDRRAFCFAHGGGGAARAHRRYVSFGGNSRAACAADSAGSGRECAPANYGPHSSEPGGPTHCGQQPAGGATPEGMRWVERHFARAPYAHGRGMVPGLARECERTRAARVLLRFRIRSVPGAQPAHRARNLQRRRTAALTAPWKPARPCRAYNPARSWLFFFSRITSTGSLPASTATSNHPIIISSQV